MLKAVLKTIISRIEFVIGQIFPRKRGNHSILYHSIEEIVTDDETGINTVTLNAFEKQINRLIEYKVNFLSTTDFQRKNGVSISFDDGYKSVLKYAVPILSQHKIPFTVFISTSKVMNHSPEYLSIEELRELSRIPGVEIGSHGHHHIPFTQCTQEELKVEIYESKRILQDLLGKPINLISFPHGQFNNSIINEIQNAGYKYIFSSLFGTNDAQQSSKILYRNVILSTDTNCTFTNKIFGFSDWQSKLQIYKFKS